MVDDKQTKVNRKHESRDTNNIYSQWYICSEN